MDEKNNTQDIEAVDTEKSAGITYDTSKDFYKGIRGELRFKAEGLFKKAKEKGISIEDIEISTVKDETIDLPGIGIIDLPTYVVKVKGIMLENQQAMMDGKQMDFNNRYQKYLAEAIYRKNIIRDENGKPVYSNKKPMIKKEPDLSLSDWEKFEIGRAIIEDKEFGLEKTITGACDRVIRKLMGENDWLYPGEARLLEEEFKEIDKRIAESQAGKTENAPARKASEKQISYFKSKLKNSGVNPENSDTIRIVLETGGFRDKKLEDLSTSEMSRLIDSVNNVVSIAKGKLAESSNVVQ